MGPAWANTTVVVMTEFGAGRRGPMHARTDHWHGRARIDLGPKIARKSAAFADWPGLDDRSLSKDVT